MTLDQVLHWAGKHGKGAVKMRQISLVSAFFVLLPFIIPVFVTLFDRQQILVLRKYLPANRQ